MGGFWVFGYGSLMWRPGFAYVRAERAHIIGYHRSLCIYSHYHRGTKQCPGLVMGLNPGGSCTGMAFYVAADEAAAVYHYLQRREQVGQTYHEKNIMLQLENGRRVSALIFVTDLSHAQFAGFLPPAAIAQIVALARGAAGTNYAYVANTAHSLRRLSIHEPQLEAVLRHLPPHKQLSERESPPEIMAGLTQQQ